MLDVKRYGEQEVQKALDQMERRRRYQRKYYQSTSGRLAQKRSQVRSILRASGFAKDEIDAIVARICLPGGDNADRAGEGGESDG